MATGGVRLESIGRFPLLLLVVAVLEAAAFWSGRQVPDLTPLQTSCVAYQQANTNAQDDLDRAQIAIGGLDPAKPGSQEIAAASEALRRATIRHC
jgi:hypothetical protein